MSKYFRLEPKKIPLIWSYKLCLAILIPLILTVTEVISSEENISSEFTDSIRSFPIWGVLLVFLEDLFFIMPIYFVKGRWLKLSLMVILGVIFVYEHSYQGNSMYAKIYYVPVIYFISVRYGFITTSLVHVINDLVAICAIKTCLHYGIL